MPATHEPIDACFTCARDCLACLHAMIGEASRTDCPHCCLECAEVCVCCARVMSAEGTFAGPLGAVCIDVCEWCAEECEAMGHDHCKRCAESCRECAAQLRRRAA